MYRPPDEFERRGGEFPAREPFDHRGVGGGGFPPRSGPPGPRGQEPPSQQQQQGRVQGAGPGQQGQPREMWGERGPLPHSSQHQQPQQKPGQLFPEPARQPTAAPLDPRAQGRPLPSVAERQGQPQPRVGPGGPPPPQAQHANIPPNEQQRREFPHRPAPNEQQHGPPRYNILL